MFILNLKQPLFVKEFHVTHLKWTRDNYTTMQQYLWFKKKLGLRRLIKKVMEFSNHGYSNAIIHLHFTISACERVNANYRHVYDDVALGSAMGLKMTCGHAIFRVARPAPPPVHQRERCISLSAHSRRIDRTRSAGAGASCRREAREMHTSWRGEHPRPTNAGATTWPRHPCAASSALAQMEMSSLNRAASATFALFWEGTRMQFGQSSRRIFFERWLFLSLFIGLWFRFSHPLSLFGCFSYLSL